MKKLIAIVLVAVLVLTLAVGSGLALADKPNNNGPKPGTDFNGPHYNLNLIGKNKVMPGDYNNPNRHTMFVPQDTTDFSTPNGEDGITIWMSQGSEFAVIDGNATDGEGSFQLAPGKYKVYIVAKAKPGGYTNITGWVYYYLLGEQYFPIGTVNVGGHSKKPKWKDATHIFYVSSSEDPFGMVPANGLGMWVFDYLAWLAAQPDVTDTAYFWQFDNRGNKLIQVRFYPM